MSKTAHTPTTAESPTANIVWGTWLRAVVSLLLLWHLAAVLVAPLSVPPSITTDAVRPVMQPYLSALYLDHGYKFFAPDPGPSHVLSYELQMADGSKRTGTLPSRSDHWPRLWYHRHFMLSEFIHDSRPDEEWEVLPGTPGPPGMPPYPAVRAREKTYIESYAAHLLHANPDAKQVTLYYSLHEIPEMAEVAEQKMELTDPAFSRRRLLGTYVPETTR